MALPAFFSLSLFSFSFLFFAFGKEKVLCIWEWLTDPSATRAAGQAWKLFCALLGFKETMLSWRTMMLINMPVTASERIYSLRVPLFNPFSRSVGTECWWRPVSSGCHFGRGAGEESMHWTVAAGSNTLYVVTSCRLQTISNFGRRWPHESPKWLCVQCLREHASPLDLVISVDRRRSLILVMPI